MFKAVDPEGYRLSPLYYDLLEYSTLPERLISILRANKITRLSDLAMMSDRQILLLRNVGPDSLAIIRGTLMSNDIQR